jgi:hypothetical protein
LNNGTIYILLRDPWNFLQKRSLEHKARLSKCKKTEITPFSLSNHNALKLELNNKNNSKIYANNLEAG